MAGEPFCPWELLLHRSAHGAGVGASTAVDASISIDLILAVALSDRGDGAAIGASAAADALSSDLVSHNKAPP